MTTTYDQFLPEVLPYAPDVSEPAALNAIRNAVMTFCEKSMIWQVSVTMDVVQGQNTYIPTLPAGTRKVNVARAWYNNSKLNSTSEDAITAASPVDWRSITGRVQEFYEKAEGGLVLNRLPDANYTGGLKLEIALAPTRASSSFDFDYIYDRWAQGIGAGALAQLMDTLGASYYKPDDAMRYRQRFHDACASALGEMDGGNGRGSFAVQMRPFVPGRRRYR